MELLFDKQEGGRGRRGEGENGRRGGRENLENFDDKMIFVKFVYLVAKTNYHENLKIS